MAAVMAAFHGGHQVGSDMASATVEKVAAGGEAAAKGGSRTKTLLLVLVPVLVLGGGAAAYFAGLLPFGAKPEADAEGATPAGHAAAEHGGGGGHEAQLGAIRPLEPFLANLADESGSRYLKTTIQVEFVGNEPPASIEARMPQIRDAVLTLLTSKTFADIRTPAGKESLRDDVIDRLNQVLQSASVKAVYFTEFIVQ